MNTSKRGIMMYASIAVSGALMLALVLPGAALLGTTTMTAPEDSIGPHGYVVVSAKHADGSEFYHEESHNVITNAGKDFISAQVGGAGGTATAQWIGISNDTGVISASHTTLTGEYTTTGLSRAQGTYAHTAGQNTFKITNTFTSTGTANGLVKAGLFTAASSGTMLAENNFTSVSLSNGDQLTITWTITLT